MKLFHAKAIRVYAEGIILELTAIAQPSDHSIFFCLGGHYFLFSRVDDTTTLTRLTGWVITPSSTTLHTRKLFARNELTTVKAKGCLADLVNWLAYHDQNCALILDKTQPAPNQFIVASSVGELTVQVNSNEKGIDAMFAASLITTSKY